MSIYSLSSASLKISVVTGSRSEYGLMHSLMKDFKKNSQIELSIIATGSHFSEKFGLTYKDIEADGFVIDSKIPGSLNTESKLGLAKTVGGWTAEFSEALDDISPDLVVVMGDRYELLAVSAACILLNIPIAHISGGEITEGAIDDQIRHSLTKSSHFHFVSNKIYADRVRQMGEEDWRICLSGEPGLDSLLRTSPICIEELSQDLGIDLHQPTAMITFHPVTLDSTPIAQQMEELFSALRDNGLQYVITYPNADMGSEVIVKHIKDFARSHNHPVVVRKSLGHRRYVSLLRFATMMIGNSSSGLVEAPAYNLPVINIGIRQSGRLRANNVIDVESERNEIKKGINWANKYDRKGDCHNPYGDGNSSGRIIKFILRNFHERTRDEILIKRFADLTFRESTRSIGSHFEIDANNFNNKANPEWIKKFYLDKNSAFVGSGRSAFHVILNEIQLKDKVLLMPDYLCGDAQIPVLKQQGINYKYYPVSKYLKISSDDMISLLTPETGAVLMINYFGLRDHVEVADKIRSYNPDICIIEDDSQAFYSMANQNPDEYWADFSFTSFLKSFAIPDGGCVRSKYRLKSPINESLSGQGIAYLLGGILKHEYLNSASTTENAGLEKNYLDLFDAAAKDVSETPVSMTAVSLALLERYPFEDWIKRRRDNYSFLLNALQSIPQVQSITNKLKNTEIPLFLPIRVAKTERNELRAYLREQQIYCPVHWPLIQELDNLEHSCVQELSQTILSLPIDHRIGFKDLDRLVQSMKSFWRKNES